MSESSFNSLSQNVNKLYYHVILPAKYGKAIFDKNVDEQLAKICLQIESQYDYIRFLEIGRENDCVHFVVESTPHYTLEQVIRVITRITSRQIFKECSYLRKQLKGVHFWSDDSMSFSISSTKCNDTIKEYIQKQGRPESDYEQLYTTVGE